MKHVLTTRNQTLLISAALEKWQKGSAQTRTLAEILSVDQSHLIRLAFPDAGAMAYRAIDAAARLGIFRRMKVAGETICERYGLEEGLKRCLAHPSDAVRGWGCFVVGACPKLHFADRLKMIRAFADDPHFGVREWAWLAMREHLSVDVSGSIVQLLPWTTDQSEYIRRFACESMRPRGVWAPHIHALLVDPSLGLPLLQALRADPSRYVQDSVANWLNDAGKSKPNWVRDTCKQWLKESDSDATARICAFALHNLAA